MADGLTETGGSEPGRTRSGLSGVGDRILAALLASLTSLANRSSIERSVAVGAWIGRAWFRMRLPRTRLVEEQLAESFPGRSKAEIDAWTSGVFEHLGRSLAELILLRGRHRTELLDQVEIDGAEHLASAQRASASGGVLIVTAHYGNWELAGIRLARLGIRLSAVFRGLSNPVLDSALLAIRADQGLESVDYEQIRIGQAGIGLVRALKSGRKVIVLLDQNARREDGIFVPFFARPARVRTGPIRLAIRTSSPILLAFIRRNRKSQGHRIQIHPVVSPIGDGAVDAETLQRHLSELTAIIESEIRVDPSQWIWTHRRWRTQPDAVDSGSEHG